MHKHMPLNETHFMCALMQSINFFRSQRLSVTENVGSFSQLKRSRLELTHCLRAAHQLVIHELFEGLVTQLRAAQCLNDHEIFQSVSYEHHAHQRL